MGGILYIVSTPLGNLEDITLRALRILREVDVVAAEDTRHSRKLLAHFDIHTSLCSYFDAAEERRAPHLLRRLQRGEDVALISDAGTPGIADPGHRLVAGAIAAGLRVVPVPGACAVTTALSAGGLPLHGVVFDGFVPAKSGARREFYRQRRDQRRTIVCFETGRRLAASLRDLVAEMGDRAVVVARELTKVHEEFVRGPAAELVEKWAVEPPRGEVTLLIAGAPDEARAVSQVELDERIERLRMEGLGVKAIARILAGETGSSRREVYRRTLELNAPDGTARAGKRA